MALNVKQQIKKQGFETSQTKKKTERRYKSELWKQILSLKLTQS